MFMFVCFVSVCVPFPNIMVLIIEFALSIILAIIGYKCYQYYKLQEKLKWVRVVPGWPILGNALEFGDNSETINDFQRLIAKYGKLIQLNFLNEYGIFTTDYNFVEFMLGTHHILDKSEDYKFFNNWLGTGLLTSEGTKWKKRRRMETPAFHFSILEQFIGYFESNGKILMELLERELDKDSVDIYPYITLYALDVICETAMGVPVNAQKNKESAYVRNVKEMCRIVMDRNFSIFKRYDLLYKLSSDYYKEQKAVKELHNVTYSVIDARKKELEEKKAGGEQKTDDLGRKKKMAFLDILLQSTIDGKPLSREDIREEVDTFMFEGHDTTSSAISFTLFLLANHPDVQKRVVEEQKNIFGDDIDRSATYNDLQAMKYLEMVIKETLRLYPSVPVIGRGPNEDIEYKGNIIPKGITVTIFTYGVLRDPDNFTDPDKFDPDRFEDNDGTRPFSFIPFSAGPRNCIGQKFAMLEIKSIISKILRNFELVPSTPEHKIVLVAEAVLKSKNGIRIKLTRRKW